MFAALKGARILSHFFIFVRPMRSRIELPPTTTSTPTQPNPAFHAQAVIEADKAILAQNPGAENCSFYMRTGRY